MSLLGEIFDGWKNLAFPSKEIEEVAKKRISICVACPTNKFTEKKTCSGCGCYMPAKVRSPRSKCPDNFWDSFEQK